MANTTGTLTTTGSVTLTKSPTDTLAQFQVSGTYGSASFVFEGSIDGTNWFPLAASDASLATVATGTLSPADNSTLVYNVPSAGFGSVRLRTTALSTGTLAVAIQSGSYVGIPAVNATSNTTFGNTSVSGTVTVTSTSANALAVGPNGATNPTLQADGSTASAATGLKIKSAAAAGGLALSVVSSGTDEALTINAKGAGTIGIGSISTGAVTITPATTITGAVTLTGAIAANNHITMADAKNIVLNATTGTKIGTATTQKLGFYNVAPVVQPAASTDATGFVAGSGTASKSDSVWAGASGASAYTVGGIVTALKALGLLAA